MIEFELIEYGGERIETETIFYLKCDNCGLYLSHTHKNKYVEFLDKLEAERQAEEQNWTIKDDKHYCPACQEELEQERVYD